MYLKKTNLKMSFALLVLFAWVPPALTQVEYQNRGNRYEGVKPKPVSGYDIELISVRVDYKEEVKQMPDWFKLRFYLEASSEVYLTVREIDYKYYYWMDKIKPEQPWKPGFENVFEWSTQDVLQQLGEIKIYDLGIVARLEKPEASKLERVAPVIFYHSQFPATINGYLFTFKTNGDARLTCSFYREEKAEAEFTQNIHLQRGGRPFTVRWDSAQAAEGSYKLVIKGYFLDTNNPIDQTVHFYHRPDVK